MNQIKGESLLIKCLFPALYESSNGDTPPAWQDIKGWNEPFSSSDNSFGDHPCVKMWKPLSQHVPSATSTSHPNYFLLDLSIPGILYLTGLQFVSRFWRVLCLLLGASLYSYLTGEDICWRTQAFLCVSTSNSSWYFKNRASLTMTCFQEEMYSHCWKYKFSVSSLIYWGWGIRDRREKSPPHFLFLSSCFSLQSFFYCYSLSSHLIYLYYHTLFPISPHFLIYHCMFQYCFLAPTLSPSSCVLIPFDPFFFMCMLC